MIQRALSKHYRETSSADGGVWQRRGCPPCSSRRWCRRPCGIRSRVNTRSCSSSCYKLEPLCCFVEVQRSLRLTRDSLLFKTSPLSTQCRRCTMLTQHSSIHRCMISEQMAVCPENNHPFLFITPPAARRSTIPYCDSAVSVL